MASPPQKCFELECEDRKIANETTPLNASRPVDCSYTNHSAGRQVNGERRKQRRTSSLVLKTGKRHHMGQNATARHDQSASTLVDVEEDERGGRGHHRRKYDPALAALRSRVTLVLENTGSVARDHLASERTFLAYTRTSLTLVTGAIALAQVFLSATASCPKTNAVHRIGTTVRTLAASTIILGMIVLFIGVQRYFAIEGALTMGKFPTARLSALVIAMSLLVLISITFSFVLTGDFGF